MPPRPRRHRWLALVPPLAILVGVPIVNGLRGYVLGLPVLLFWILCCVLLTSLVMAVIGALDRRADRADALAAAAAREREGR